jgi:hypothetical protein
VRGDVLNPGALQLGKRGSLGMELRCLGCPSNSGTISRKKREREKKDSVRGMDCRELLPRTSIIFGIALELAIRKTYNGMKNRIIKELCEGKRL